MDKANIELISEEKGWSIISKTKAEDGFVWEFESDMSHLRYSPRAIVASRGGADFVLAHTDHIWLLADMDDWEPHIPHGEPMYDYVAGKLCVAASRTTRELNPLSEWPDIRMPALVRQWGYIGVGSESPPWSGSREIESTGKEVAS